jgi:hypothetical protein
MDSTAFSDDEQRTIDMAFEWLDTYRALCRGQRETRDEMSVRPARAGTHYEIWATLTLIYMLNGFCRGVYPMPEVAEAVQAPPDFITRVNRLIARLEQSPDEARGGAAAGAAAAASACYA